MHKCEGRVIDFEENRIFMCFLSLGVIRNDEISLKLHIIKRCKSKNIFKIEI